MRRLSSGCLHTPVRDPERGFRSYYGVLLHHAVLLRLQPHSNVAVPVMSMQAATWCHVDVPSSAETTAK